MSQWLQPRQLKRMQSQRIKAAVRELLEANGENPDRPELLSTPDKVADAYASFFKGVGGYFLLFARSQLKIQVHAVQRQRAV